MHKHLLEFCRLTGELLESEPVRMMGRWQHHGRITTLDHSLFVAYLSFRAARWLRLDERAAARGGLLHDLYLYDPRDKSAHPGNQCFDHPRAAARNAEQVTKLSDKERNIILSHMWPLGWSSPTSITQAACGRSWAWSPWRVPPRPTRPDLLRTSSCPGSVCCRGIFRHF